MNITVKGLKTEYIESGEGTPVLLLHGWGSSFDVYKGIMDILFDIIEENDEKKIMVLKSWIN